MPEKTLPGLLFVPLLALMLIAGAAVATPASVQCSDDWVCVEPDRQGDELRFIARNLKPYPLTLSLKIEGIGLEPPPEMALTRTLAPNEQRVLDAFEVAEGHDYRYWYDWAIGEQNPQHDASYIYRLPYADGESWPILQGFDSNFSHQGLERYGVDFDMPVGTPVHAAREGTVARVVEAHDRGCWADECGRYANFIVVVHADGTTGEYYHLKQHGAVVNEGDHVERGQLIAYSGNTGHTTRPHLHFAVYRADSWGTTQSLPVRFATVTGQIVERPRPGSRYVAAAG